MMAGFEETQPAIFFLNFDQSNDGGLGGSGLLGTVAPYPYAVGRLALIF